MTLSMCINGPLEHDDIKLCFLWWTVFIFWWGTWKKGKMSFREKLWTFLPPSLPLPLPPPSLSPLSLSLCIICISICLNLSLYEIRSRINLAVWPIILWCTYSYVALQLAFDSTYFIRDERVRERLIFIVRSSLAKINSYVFCLSTSRFAARRYRASFDPCDEYRPFASTITNWVMRWNTWRRRLVVHDRLEIKHLDSFAIEFAIHVFDENYRILMCTSRRFISLWNNCTYNPWQFSRKIASIFDRKHHCLKFVW